MGRRNTNKRRRLAGGCQIEEGKAVDGREGERRKG